MIEFNNCDISSLRTLFAFLNVVADDIAFLDLRPVHLRYMNEYVGAFTADESKTLVRIEILNFALHVCVCYEIGDTSYYSTSGSDRGCLK